MDVRLKPSANKKLNSNTVSLKTNLNKTPPAAVLETIKKLKKFYPGAHCELTFHNPFELLVATILSAQCTDVRVNMVTPRLFKMAPDAKKMSVTSLDKIEETIRSTGFYKNKAKNIWGMSRTLVEKYGGLVPQDLEQLVELPGVGRKTANVVLGNAYNITTGVVVDTHVSRLSQRLGWTSQKTPEKIERDLEKLVPREDWILISHLLISHGRHLCKARNPDCQNCFLLKDCPAAKSLQKS